MIRQLIEKQLSTSVCSVKKVGGGLVHYVYLITTADNTIYFAKVRKDHYAALPTIKTDATLIANEYKALGILSTMMPDMFPEIISYIPSEHMLILSDIMPHRMTLENKLNENNISPQMIYNLGKTIAEIHKKLASVSIPIREDGDIAYYNQLHEYRFGYHKHLILDDLMQKLQILPRQLVLGDLSPKNIGISQEGKVTLCDLENCHLGNTISDVGFLASSIVLHTIQNRERAYTLLMSFIRGYTSIVPIRNTYILKRIILGIALYRLNNPVIPYDLDLTKTQKEKKIEEIKQVLFAKKISWGHIVNTITLDP